MISFIFRCHPHIWQLSAFQCFTSCSLTASMVQAASRENRPTGESGFLALPSMATFLDTQFQHGQHRELMLYYQVQRSVQIFLQILQDFNWWTSFSKFFRPVHLSDLHRFFLLPTWENTVTVSWCWNCSRSAHFAALQRGSTQWKMDELIIYCSNQLPPINRINFSNTPQIEMMLRAILHLS